MTITYSILRTSTSTASVNVPQITQSSMELAGVTRDPVKGVVESQYTIPSGDPNYPTTIVVRVTQDPKDRTGSRRALIAINSFAVADDSVTGGIERKPISAVMNLQLPGMVVEAADLAALVGNLYGLTFNTLTAGVPDTQVLSNLMFGLTSAY